MQKFKLAKLSIGLFLLILAGIAAGFLYNKETQTPVAQIAQEQMEALKKGNITRAYYLFTSDNYQDEQTLEEFREWVRDNPIVTQNDALDLYGETIQGNTATITGGLKYQNEPGAHIVYQLVNEYGGWKIDNIQLLEPREELTLSQTGQIASPHDEKIAELIQDHLLDLKTHNLRKTYDQHLAPEFKKTISYEDYESIIRENPELTEYELIQFGNVDEENGLKRIQVTLISDDETQNVRFWLAKLQGKWMIWAMEVNGPTAQEVYDLGDDVAMNDDKEITGDQQKDEIIILIKKQLDIIKEGDIAKAYQDFAAKEFMEATSEEEFKKFINNYPEFKDYKSVRFGKKSETNDIILQQVILVTEKGDSEIDYWVSKPEDEWKVWGIRVEESAYYPPISKDEKGELVQIIEGQLKSLRDGDISKAYYAYVSQDFENNTSFDDFKSFLEEYPIFTKQDDVNVGNGVQEGDLRLVRIALQSEEETAEVDYRLIQQDGDWKIWGIQILTNVQDTPENEDEVESAIQDQIAALRDGDLSKAYYAFTSKQFQEAASFDTFDKYVKRHDELSDNKTVEVKDVMFKPNYAVAQVNLKANSDESEPYQYRLVYENSKWKILSIKMIRGEDEKDEATSTLTISKIQIGTEIDLNGLVTNPTTTFSPQDSELTVNVYVKDGQVGDQVEAVLEHVKTKSSIPPVTAKLDKAGESVVNYIFTAPSQGWPKGAYRIHLTTSTGAEEAFEFTVK